MRYFLLPATLSLFLSCNTVQKLAERMHLGGKNKEAEIINQPIPKTQSTAAKEVKIAEPTIAKKETILEKRKPEILTHSLNGAPIKIVREFRAAWVATVANIDWPSKPGLSSYEQQQEAIELLDFLKDNQFNAVIFQVRPQSDALYKSDIEPWSYFLSGEQGVAPEPYYDPLAFWIEESHKRGLELHAWLNPYRAHHTKGSTISDKSIVKTNPELVYRLQEGYYWMDPAMKATQDQTSKVVMDIVKRYDVDGIHFDDYFYPYPSYNGGKDFPDDKSYNDYLKNGGNLTRGDWRRNAVNTLIERLYKEIKQEKKWVKFGLSPFGIWRPGYPSTVTGFDQYEKLYADAKLWLNNGWIDYFAPQLYWPINKTGQRFPDLLSWWQSENKLQRHLWPGISIENERQSASNSSEILNEISLTHDLIPNSKGAIHWNISSLLKNPDLTNNLLNGPYNEQALVPSSPWLDSDKPSAPTASIKKNNQETDVEWKLRGNDIAQCIVYAQYGNNWEYYIFPKNEMSTKLPNSKSEKAGSISTLKNIIVTSIDRSGNESDFYSIPVQ